MARHEEMTISCSSCDRLVSDGESLCACGQPTEFMSFADRAMWEAAQWRAHRERQAS